MRSKYRIQIKGLNLHHTISFFESNNFLIEDLVRQDHQSLSVTLSKDNYKLFKSSSLYNLYHVKIIKTYGTSNFLKKLLSKSGLFVGIIAITLFSLHITSRVQEIHFNIDNHTCYNKDDCIFSKDNLSKLIETLNVNGIYEKVSINKIPPSRAIEQILMKEFQQIAGVSVTRRGVHLNIDIVEARLKHPNQALDLIAEESGIVVSINVTNGSSNVKNGDIVLKGDTLIKSIDYKPVVAEVVLRTFYHDSIVYNENQETYLRTGKSQTHNSLSLFGLSLRNEKVSPYKLYESTNSSSYAFLNLFLPVKVYATKYYELKKVETISPYSEQSETLKKTLQATISENIPTNAEIKNTTYTEFREDSRVRLDCYIEAFLTLKKEG